MAEALSSLHDNLIQLSETIQESLSKAQYNPEEGTNVSVKSMLESLLPRKTSISNRTEGRRITEDQIQCEIKDFSLCCAALASAQGSNHASLSWIPKDLSVTAVSAFEELSKAFSANLNAGKSTRIVELGVDCSLVSDDKKLVVELIPLVMPLLKASIKESSINHLDDCDEVSAASARAPLAYAVVAAYQLRWFVTQVEQPHLGRLCSLVIPCALTALDHWSPEVKGQGMISFIHLGKNVKAAEFSWYEDVILDTCCQNIASSDEIWHLVVEMSVLLVTCIHGSNPRSSWYERILNEMLNHLERQPKNKDRYTPWLQHIEPLFSSVGLVLLAHFRRIFPLFFQWMHSDNDQTLLLVLKRVYTVTKLTWIRNTPYVERLVDELAVTYKEAALRRAREEIRTHVIQMLILLQQCKALQFEAAWNKHRDDPNLTTLGPSFNTRNAAMVVQ